MRFRALKTLVAVMVAVMALGALAPATADPLPMAVPTQEDMSTAMEAAADWMLVVTNTDGQLSPPGGSPSWEVESGGRMSMNGLALLRAYQTTGDQTYLDRAEACGDLALDGIIAGRTYVIDRTGVLVTEAGGGFTNAQTGKIDDAFQSGHTDTIRFELWESLRGMWFLTELFGETGENRYANGALLLDRLLGDQFYYVDDPRRGLVSHVTLSRTGTWTPGGIASTTEHAVMLRVLAAAGDELTNLWRDQLSFFGYILDLQEDNGSFDDRDPLPNQDGSSEVKHALMIPALYDLGLSMQARDLAAWVIGQQQTDGSFECPHDKDVPGDTFTAAMGLLPIGEVTAGGDAVSWLLGQQRPDGSWDGLAGLDIVTSRLLSTEWAMLALHAGLTNYNLRIDDQMVEVAPIWVGDPGRVMGFTVNVTVENEGLVPVTGAVLKVYDGPRSGKDLLDETTIDVPALGTVDARLEFRPGERGPHEIHVWVEYTPGGEFRGRDNNVSVPVNINREPTGTIATPTEAQLFGFGQIIIFEAAEVEDLDGDPVTMTWTDDVTGLLSHQATFNRVLPPGVHFVVLTFEDGNGPSTSANVTFSVRDNIPPTIRISTPAEGTRYFDYEAITFNASASSDAEGHDLFFTWESDGAGFMGVGEVITKRLEPGPHTITVWVDDSWDNMSRSVSIHVIRTFPPDAVISSPVDGEIYVTTTRVEFDATGTTDQDSEVLQYFWYSNIDGLLSERPSFLAKLTVGHHFIKLAVDDDNYNVTTTIEIDVLANRPPVALISSPEHDSIFHSTEMVHLNASESYDLEDAITYFWVSDRSGILGTKPVIIRHLARGDHTITLWVDDDHGHNVSTHVSVTILNVGPTAGISSPEAGASLLTKAKVQFMSDTSHDPEDDKLLYEWFLRHDSGDWASMGTTARLQHTFKESGQYEVRLVVSDGKEQDETTVHFTVKQAPDVIEDGISSGTWMLIGGAVLLLVIVAVVLVLRSRR